MSSSRVVWSGYKPFYENAKASSQPYNPVELMGYVGFAEPYWAIRGIGAFASDDNLAELALWTAEIQENGTLGSDKGPMYFSEKGVYELDAQVVLPPDMIAVAWGMKASNGEISNIVVWARKWNSSAKKLEGEAVAYNFSGNNDVEMFTPVSENPQQILIGVGGGVKSNNVNRIAAGYATLGMSPESSEVPVVWGAVDENGNRVSGSNFSCKRVETGVYSLTWTNTPAIRPVIGLTSGTRSDESEGSDNVISFDDVTTTGCTVYSVDVGSKKNKAQDEAFSFVAFFPAGDISGLLFGTVDKNGNAINGSNGWASSRSDKGKYKIEFNPAMDPMPNLIMSAGMRSDETGGSDNVISNDVPSTTKSHVYSLDVGDGNTKSQDEIFSFFAWNVNVLPMDPLTHNMKIVAKHRITPGEKLAVVDAKMMKKGEKAESVFYVPDHKGDGHWKIDFNFPLPEVPIIFASAVKEDDEKDGARRIISYQGASKTSYDVWSVRVGNGKEKAVDGALEITVTLPDQFPI